MIDKDWEEKLMKNIISHGTGLMRMLLNKSGGIDVDIVDPKDYRYCIKEPQIQVSFNSEIVGHIEPQRKWVGLTYEDMVALQKELFDKKGEMVLPTTFARAIEAKLKEKNT